jgi:carboxymethylenebutenolidase
MTRLDKFTTTNGVELDAALAEPAGSEKAGGIVVIQEWWGISPFIKLACDRFAESGFLALAPDLYGGTLAKTQEEAAQLMMSLDKRKALSDVTEAVARLKAHRRSNGKIAVLGFCMGGGFALAAARQIEGIAAAVPFYGIPPLPLDEYTKVRVPIQAHFAKNDDFAKASVALEIQAKVRAGGGHMDLFVYDAGHAFMRSTDPAAYDAASSQLAWARALEFLKRHLD